MTRLDLLRQSRKPPFCFLPLQLSEHSPPQLVQPPLLLQLQLPELRALLLHPAQAVA